MTTITTMKEIYKVALSGQISNVDRLHEWIEVALADPEVAKAIGKNEALLARLQTILQVTRATQDNTMERLKELANGGEPA